MMSNSNPQQILGYNHAVELAKQRFLLMNKERWNFNDFVIASNFYTGFETFSEDDDGTSKQSDIRWEINDPNGSDGKGGIIHTMSPPQITEFLAVPSNTRHFKALYDYSLGKRLESFDPITRAVILSWRPSMFPSWKFHDFSDQYWTKWMTGGQVGVICGNKGSGKTDFAVNLGSKAAQNDSKKRFISNIKILDEYYQDSYFGSLSQMFNKILDNIIAGYTSFVVVDETITAGIRRKTAMGKATLTMDVFDRATRKLGVDMLYIFHFESEIPKETAMQTTFMVHKLGNTEDTRSRKKAFITWKGQNDNVVKIDGIPPSPVEFASRAFAPFSLDLDLQAVFDAISRIEEQGYEEIEMARKVKDIIVKLKQKESEEIGEEEEVQIKNGLFHNEFLKKYKVSAPTITKWVQDGKLGTGEYYGKKTYFAINDFDPLTRKFQNKEDDGDE